MPVSTKNTPVKRGRPRKATTVAKNQTPAKRGRPKKASTVAKANTPAKRGRPKKASTVAKPKLGSITIPANKVNRLVKSIETIKDIFVDSAETPIPAKPVAKKKAAKVGRPKKAHKVSTAPKKRGRPKKQNLVSSANPTKTVKRANVYPKVVKMIRENPNLKKFEMVDAILKEHKSVSKLTAVQYYYKARKELDLNTNGERGRPKSNKLDDIASYISNNMHLDASKLQNQISENFNLSPKSAVVYYYKAKKMI